MKEGEFMEYKLNKIDTELRNTVNEATREGKVHAKKGININKDKSKDKQPENKQQKDEKKEPFSLSKYANKKKTIEVKAVKVDSIQVEVTKEGDTKKKNSYKGLFIDIRR